jgi:RNase P/RNase MRP subunit p30
MTENKYTGKDLKRGLQDGLTQQQKLVNFALNHKTHLISYEHLIRNPEKEIQKLAKYCGIELTEELKQKALDFIQSGTYKNL